MLASIKSQNDTTVSHCLPIGQRSSALLKKMDFCVVGISLFNSKFTVEYIAKCLKLALNFDDFRIYIPDSPNLHNFTARGKSESEAEKKVRKQLRWVKNKILKASLSVGIKGIEKKIIIHSKHLNNYYCRLLEEISNTYEQNSDFKELCQDESKNINLAKEAALNSNYNVDEAVKFILKELPFIASSSKLLNKKSAIFLYHRSSPLFDALFDERLYGLANQDSGYGVVC